MEINEKRVNQHLRSFEKALNSYNYDEPLSRFLTRFFKENKQMGSSDRRMTSRFCYNYFRLGNSLKEYNNTERLVFAEYLCTTDSSLVGLLNPALAASLSLDLKAKIAILTTEYNFSLEEVFPLTDEFSTDVAKGDFLESHFIQPDLFIRIRRGKEEVVKSAFENNDVVFTSLGAHTLALPNGTNLQKVLNLEGMYEVQDLSSQKTIEFIHPLANGNWWDACAASGGKALMVLDKFPETNLLVSDIRMSILRNLEDRFGKAEIRTAYRKKIIDLSQSADNILHAEEFDGILLDVPCSGSGTWGRTPEMIQQFGLEKLQSYSELQKTIATNAIPYLKKGASLVYITCSIYKQENEDVVQYIVDNFQLKLDKMELIKGYDNKADSMFAAHFIKE